MSMTSADPDGPVFAHGITPRSGTNFLLDALELHPDARHVRIGEPHINEEMHLLDRYAGALGARWTHSDLSRSGRDFAALARRALGDALVGLLGAELDPGPGERPGGRLVTRTPSTSNLRSFFDFFPRAHLVILTRDGRDVVTSGVRSGFFDFRHGIYRWLRGAEGIFGLLDRPDVDRDRVLIIKYEDLTASFEETFRRVLDHVGMDAGAYDFAAGKALRVRGSSEHGRAKRQDLQEKTEKFRSVGRWQATWTRAMHERFNWLAGPAMTRLGYDLERHPGGEAGWATWNRMLDARSKAARWAADRMPALRPALRKLVRLGDLGRRTLPAQEKVWGPPRPVVAPPEAVAPR